MSYAQLKAAGIDAFGNALVELENEFPFDSAPRRRRAAIRTSSAAFGIGRTLYFCIPPNDKLLAVLGHGRRTGSSRSATA